MLHRRHAGLVGEVSGYDVDPHLTGHLAGELFEPILASRHQGQVAATGGEDTGDLGADTAGGAGDERGAGAGHARTLPPGPLSPGPSRDLTSHPGVAAPSRSPIGGSSI